MERILKWGIGLTILVTALTIAPAFFFSKDNNVVEGLKSSTTLSYEEKRQTSVVVIEKELNDELILPINYVEVISNSQKYNEFMVDVEIEKKRIQIEKDEQLMLAILKAKKERLAKERANKEKQKQMPSRGSVNRETLILTATAYTPYCYGCSGITYTGHDARKSITYNGMRVIATDKNVIPMYSIVKIRYGDTEFHAISLDTGGAIKGYKIDLLVNSREEAYKFGKRKVEITIVKRGK